MNNITLTIDGNKVTTPAGTALLKAAQGAGIYIPHLCSHPDLPPAAEAKASSFIYRGNQKILGMEMERQHEGCRLCLVEVEGKAEPQTSCTLLAEQGMVVHSQSPRLEKLRRDNLSRIFVSHPHACLLCAQREGCAREPCSMKVPQLERCCIKLGRCELEKVADYLGLAKDISRYTFRDLPIVKDEPLFVRDYNLCINCTRCVRACRDLRGIDALGFVFHNGQVVVGTRGPTLKESGCKFCGACVEVCPTGALLDKEMSWVDREKALVPCRYTCPVNMDIPRYISQITVGNPSAATAIIRESVPFPNVLGHVCSHPCESVCRRGQVNESIAICALKRFAAEGDTGLWKKSSRVAAPTGKRVGIVGAGPAGLTAAFHLAKQGHTVILYDSLAEPGGMLLVGIPHYRLPRDIARKDIDEILKLGINLKLNTTLGADSPPETLKQNYDALFLATGTHQSRVLKIEGVELEGVWQGVYFLRDAALGKLPKDLFSDKTVAVIGGGNVAIDAARTALRLGAKSLQLSCLESPEEMPAHEWEVQQAVEEGVIINPCWGPQRIIGKNGKVAGIEFIACTSVFDTQKKFAPTYDKESGMSQEADAVIMAIGQAPDLPFLEKSQVERTRGGGIKVDPATLETSLKGVFAGGDLVSGPASVVEAIAAGRKAAASIDKCMGGAGDIAEVLAEKGKPKPWMGREEDFAFRAKSAMPCLAPQERVKSFAEVELGFDDKLALAEAQRCLKCGLRLQISAPILPPEKWLPFTPENVKAVSEKEGVFQLLNEEKEVVFIAGRENLRSGLEEHLGADPSTAIGSARYFLYEENPMYTGRESELIQQYLQEHGSMPPGNDEALF